MLAENTIAIARHNLVNHFSKPARQHAPDSRPAPDTAELFQHVEDCVRARKQIFSGLVMVFHDVNRVEVVRVHAMSRQQRTRKFALQRRKPETIALISLEQKLNETITESANAVVENNRVGVSC